MLQKLRESGEVDGRMILKRNLEKQTYFCVYLFESVRACVMLLM